MNAADYYGLEELRRACAGFVQCCINVDTVCALLASAERYIQYKCTKSLVQKVLEFVDEHGNEVLNLGSFTLLPQHVVRLILAREELRADEFTKFQAALMWSKKYCDNNPVSDLFFTIHLVQQKKENKNKTKHSQSNLYDDVTMLIATQSNFKH